MEKGGDGTEIDDDDPNAFAVRVFKDESPGIQSLPIPASLSAFRAVAEHSHTRRGSDVCPAETCP
jgi:hypothetical protein